MVGRARYLCLLAAIGFGPCIRTTVAAAQEDGLYQWRQTTSEDIISLFAATSEAADSYGGFTIKCKLHSGVAEVESQIDERIGLKFAELIAKGLISNNRFYEKRK